MFSTMVEILGKIIGMWDENIKGCHRGSCSLQQQFFNCTLGFFVIMSLSFEFVDLLLYC